MIARPPRRRRRRGGRSLLLGLALSSSLVGCGTGDDADARVVVFAASSLTDVFADLETRYEAAHPGVDVVVSYAGSSTLATQLAEGAPADVFASADERTMDRAVADGAVRGEPEVFASNRLTIAVQAGNPEGINGLADLADPGLVVVLAAPEVPAGAYAAEVFRRAGVVPSVDSLESSVRAAASKVALGEADAAVVYRTDVAAATELDEVAIPSEARVDARYPIATVARGADAAVDASGFVELVTGAEGRRALTDAGFEVP